MSGGNYFRRKFYDEGTIFRGDIFLGGNGPGGYFPLEQLPSGTIVLGAIIRGEIIQGAIARGAIIWRVGAIFFGGQLCGHHFISTKSNKVNNKGRKN